MINVTINVDVTDCTDCTEMETVLLDLIHKIRMSSRVCALLYEKKNKKN